MRHTPTFTLTWSYQDEPKTEGQEAALRGEPRWWVLAMLTVWDPRKGDLHLRAWPPRWPELPGRLHPEPRTLLTLRGEDKRHGASPGFRRKKQVAWSLARSINVSVCCDHQIFKQIDQNFQMRL